MYFDSTLRYSITTRYFFVIFSSPDACAFWHIACCFHTKMKRSVRAIRVPQGIASAEGGLPFHIFLKERRSLDDFFVLYPLIRDRFHLIQPEVQYA